MLTNKMHDFLKSLEIKPVAVIDPLQISLDHIGRFGKGLSVPSKDSQFLLYFFSKCLKVLQLYCPIPDLRPKILCFAPLKEAADALEIDTTVLTLDEVVAKMEQIIRKKLNL